MMGAWKRVQSLLGIVALVAGAVACGGSGHDRRTGAAPTPSGGIASTPPAEAPPAVAPTAFGMHFLSLGQHPYPALPFGTARIWDMGTTWADLQPSPHASLTDPGANPALAHLDVVVKTFRSHGVQPVLTLGMTPAWAARACNHRHYGQDWGSQTCAPRGNVSAPNGVWATYVRAMAKRYVHKVRYFELWNEPSLANGYNDSLDVLAKMQATALPIVRQYGGHLISPGIPFTNGAPDAGYHWLDSFFSQAGGTSFDVVGLHLYPSDDAVRRGDGPEWAIETALTGVRAVLAQHHLSNRPIWNTETNVGRAPAHTGYGDALAGAGAVARTFILATENGVARTIWYAADDRSWGGTWLETFGFAGISTAGLGERTAYQALVHREPRGCQRIPNGAGSVYLCAFGPNKASPALTVAWTTGGSYRYRVPTGINSYINVIGSHKTVHAGATLTLTSLPVYLLGA